MAQIDNSDSLWELARASTRHVSSMAATLAAQKRMPGKRERILGELSGRLMQVHAVLEKPSLDQQKLLWGRLEKLLAELERVCTWSKDSGQRCTARMSNSVASEELQRVLSLRFPTLHAVISASEVVDKRVRLGLIAFASAHHKIVNDYFYNLDRFSTPKGKGMEDVAYTPEQSVGRTTKCFEAPDEYPAYVNQNLYAALYRHSSCACFGLESPECTVKQHWSRLRLKGRYQTRDNHVLFDLLYSATPPTLSTNAVYWQQLQLHVLRKNPCSKGVKFLDEEEKESPMEPPPNEGRAQVVEVGTFCKLLRRRLGDVRVCLKLQAGELFQLYDGEQVNQYIIPTPSISLAKVLEVCRLSAKMKIVLAYILARSVWQFYDSDWMKNKWTSEVIHFMQERSPDEVDTEQPKTYACNPCFAFQFDDSGNDFTEYCDSFSIIHRYPRVLALGILLVEIGGEVHAAGTSGHVQPLEEQINNDWTMGMHTLRDGRWPDINFFSSGAVVQTYKRVVTNCFDRMIFNVSTLPTHAGPEQGIEGRRAILYEHVVYPLEELLTNMGWIDALGNIEPMESTKLPAQRPSIQRPDPLQPQLLDTTTDSVYRESERWLNKIVSSSLNKGIVLNYRNNACTQASIPRIKVAILDTGYDKEAVFFNRHRNSRIKKWKDWVINNSPDPQDQDGHGTHVLSLLMKIAPAADIFVARIAKETEDLQSASDNVAKQGSPYVKAITWAANECNADIVSMSFGFPEEVLVENEPVISNAILQAVQKRNGSILFFAAAANFGANQKEMFPANHELVISIRGTNSQGVFQDFNPPPDRDGPAVFGTLGKDVSSAWLSTYEGEICKSGTSVATPIAAGIAAMILGYANLCFGEQLLLKRNPLSKLRTRQGMLSMFSKMSICMQEKCFYLSPFDFMVKTDEGRRAEMIVAAGDARDPWASRQ